METAVDRPSSTDAAAPSTAPASLAHTVIRSIQSNPAAYDANWSDYLSNYATDEQVSAGLAHARDAIVSVVPNFASTSGCDLGCWFGISSLLLRSHGARVHGVDVDARFIDAAEKWRAAHGVGELHFATMRAGVVPLLDRTMDWVMICQVLCNADPARVPQILGEAARILKPGGLLVLNDSNNPHCPGTMERLRTAWRNRELGAKGSPQKPAGPYHNGRLRIIEQRAGEMKSAARQELARNTCYLGGAELIRTIDRARHGQAWTPSPFDESSARPPCDPATGHAAGNVTDPFAIAAELGRQGLDVHVTTQAGGPRVDEPSTLLAMLRESQGFYLYARKGTGGHR